MTVFYLPKNKEKCVAKLKNAMHWRTLYSSIAPTVPTKHNIPALQPASTVSYLTNLSNDRRSHGAAVLGLALCNEPFVCSPHKSFEIFVCQFTVAWCEDFFFYAEPTLNRGTYVLYFTYAVLIISYFWRLSNVWDMLLETGQISAMHTVTETVKFPYSRLSLFHRWGVQKNWGFSSCSL